jgi:hypothetical protein
VYSRARNGGREGDTICTVLYISTRRIFYIFTRKMLGKTQFETEDKKEKTKERLRNFLQNVYTKILGKINVKT